MTSRGELKRKRDEEEKDMTYVWYACYGSNINKERFMKYINRCTDKTEPVEDRPYEFKHPVFFAGTSLTWDGKGKAFLDDNAQGHAFGRIYKITNEQYREIKANEGSDYTKKVELESIEGIPVVTFTCRHKSERSVPSTTYLDVILAGLRETYPDVRESAVAADLIRGIFNDDEIRILDCMRKSEHGLAIRNIAEITGMESGRVKELISALVRINAIRQDRRSLLYEKTDDRAVFFTETDARTLIDKVRELIAAENNMQGVAVDDPLITSVAVEGGRRMILSTRYERNAANRREAIRIHGTVCQVCGFDFLEHYGELGRNYIEVHHLRPLSTLDEQVEVDPETDLVCLCANCHRMMHRSREHVMTVEELRVEYRA